MGNQNRARDPGEPHPALEAALARLAKAFGEAEAERVRLDEIQLELGRAPRRRSAGCGRRRTKRPDDMRPRPAGRCGVRVLEGPSAVPVAVMSVS